MHDDRTGCEPTGLEEVLGQPVAGKDVSVEPGDAAFSQDVEGHLPHLFRDGDFASLTVDVDQPDRADQLPVCLCQETFHSGQEETEWVAVDLTEQQDRLRVCEGLGERVCDGLVETIRHRPHDVKGFHLFFQVAIEINQRTQIALGSRACRHPHDVRRVIRPTPQTVTSRMASITMLVPILEIPLVRSLNVIGTSSIDMPAWWARQAIST